MSQYKSALRSQQNTESTDSSHKYRQQARQLQELFPTWSNDDLQSLLVEVHGDVELAATRISDGVAEQWGSVSRKKDKKAPSSATATKESFSPRGESRGARGGRGGRGGPGRGGAAVRGRGGPTRGSPVNGRSPIVASPSQGQVDVAPAESTETKDAADVVDVPPAAVAPGATIQQNGVAPPAGRTDSSSSHLITPALSASSSWGGVSTTSTWGGDTEPNGSTASVNVAPKPVSKPATSKLSWAQIARPQEKPAPLPAPAAPSHPTPPQPAPQPTAPEPEQESQTWEEPTTAQGPTWEDEPQAKEAEEAKEEQAESQAPQEHEAEVEPTKEPVSAEPETKQTLPASKSEPAPLAPLVTPVLSQTAAATPSPKLAGRPAASAHRTSARYKNTDQPVVMPSSSFGSIEKVGMQFGSLSLGGDSLLDSTPEPEAPTAAPEPPSPPTTQAPPPAQDLAPPPPPATAPASTSLGSTIFSQQQAQPQVQQAAPVQPSATLHTIPTSVSQPTQQTPAHTAAAASPIQQFAQQQHQQAQHQAQHHSLASHQQQLHQQQQHAQHPQPTAQAHNQYAQHGLPTHIDPQQAQSQQPHSATHHSSYFGRGEAAAAAPYFHTPTPPVGQAQDNPYGSFGQQLGSQGQHQQASHLGGFGAQEYGYGDNQRNFYDTSYHQQGGFGNRNVLGHEDVKGLPGTQQQPPSAGGIPPSTSQNGQPHGSLQAGGQPQPAGAQAPQQGYAVPYPYYTYPPQNQGFYQYGPNYGAVPQPFKYPLYQPGPGSAPSPVAKQPGSGVGVQPQGNPYSQGLYPQGGYDDYQQHAHHSQHSQQHSHGLSLGQGGVGAGEYGKQLYGGAGQGGIQGFIGLGQGASGAGGPASNAGAPRGAGSPETPYKPYAPKDVGGVAAGRNAGQQQGQVQGQPQGQGQGGGPQGQGFYGGARFGAGAGGAGVGGGPQQNAHHPQGGPQGHLGYPQGGNDGNFYGGYRGQQQYWQ